MQVTATLSRQEKVEISDHEARRIAAKLVSQLFNVPLHAYVRSNGQLAEDHDVRCGSHSDIETKELRPATDDDRAAVRVLAELRRGHHLG